MVCPNRWIVAHPGAVRRSPLVVLLAGVLTFGAAAAMLCADPGTSQAQGSKTKRSKHKPVKNTKKHRRTATASHRTAAPRPIERTRLYPQCPPEMVNVRGRFCIDRWEDSTVDASSGRPLSPYFPPDHHLANLLWNQWTAEFEQEKALATGTADGGAASPIAMLSLDAGSRTPLALSIPGPVRNVALIEDSADDDDAQDEPPAEVVADAGADAGADAAATPREPMALPVLPPWEQGGEFSPMAVSRPNVTPQGYTPGYVAAAACRAAGKRLCREEEWVTACKGERGQDFPYGATYRQGACNVFREDHPARILHGSCSSGLSDPRLNLVQVDGADLLRETGGSPMCVSRWGNDAIYDMVGNVDEWVDDPDGLFLGGFYARNTRKGCEARVNAHPTTYFDYSLGFRCCADLAP